VERDIHTKGPLLELDATYVIKKFFVRASKQTYVPFEKQYMIEFTSFTTVVPVRNPAATFPEYIYNITPYSKINPVYPASTKYIGTLIRWQQFLSSTILIYAIFFLLPYISIYLLFFIFRL
jgi:hypothetical protein